jgi:hypothetical protein
LDHLLLYQVALLKHLNGHDIDTYLDFGLDFMTDPDNLEVPSRRERKTLIVRSLLNVQPPQPEWDEAVCFGRYKVYLLYTGRCHLIVGIRLLICSIWRPNSTAFFGINDTTLFVHRQLSNFWV